MEQLWSRGQQTRSYEFESHVVKVVDADKKNIQS